MPNFGEPTIPVEIWQTPNGWRYKAGDEEDGNYVTRDWAEEASWRSVRRQLRQREKNHRTPEPIGQ